MSGTATPHPSPDEDHEVKPSFSLDRGPLAAALDELDRAAAAVDAATAAVSNRRDDFVRLLGEAVSAHVAMLGEAAYADVAEIIAHLYWEDERFRVADLATALGCSPKEVRSVAGSRTVTVPCRTCAASVVAVQTSRSSTPYRTCSACAERHLAEDAARHEQWRQGSLPYYGSPPVIPARHRPELIDEGVVLPLLVHLQGVLRDGPCDNQLTLSRRWARSRGFDENALVAVLEARGGYCDCEVVANVVNGQQISGGLDRPARRA